MSPRSGRGRRFSYFIAVLLVLLLFTGLFIGSFINVWLNVMEFGDLFIRPFYFSLIGGVTLSFI
ncbi:MAG: hypothetical protein NYU39_04485, partial [Aigarchaeota archaeon]|nr:hypothetical protein [Candidatus Caldarchaeales archaeon]